MSTHLITLQQIRDQRPCEEGWKTLLTALGNPKDLNLQVSIGDVAKSNGAQDALWCCRCISDRRFVVSLIMPAVKRASVHTTDSRVHECISALEKWLAGDDSVDLDAAPYYAANAARGATAVSAAAYAISAAAYPTRAAVYEAYIADLAACNAAACAAAIAATYAADAAAYAAAYAADAADAADAAEREQQVRDIIALAPLHAFAGEVV